MLRLHVDPHKPASEQQRGGRDLVRSSRGLAGNFGLDADVGDTNAHTHVGTIADAGTQSSDEDARREGDPLDAAQAEAVESMLDLLPAEERDDRQLVTITRNLCHLLNADGFAVACEAIEKNIYQPRLEGSRAAYAYRSSVLFQGDRRAQRRRLPGVGGGRRPFRTVTGPRSQQAAARNAAEYVQKEGPHED